MNTGRAPAAGPRRRRGSTTSAASVTVSSVSLTCSTRPSATASTLARCNDDARHEQVTVPTAPLRKRRLATAARSMLSGRSALIARASTSVTSPPRTRRTSTTCVACSTTWPPEPLRRDHHGGSGGRPTQAACSSRAGLFGEEGPRSGEGVEVTPVVPGGRDDARALDCLRELLCGLEGRQRAASPRRAAGPPRGSRARSRRARTAGRRRRPPQGRGPSAARRGPRRRAHRDRPRRRGRARDRDRPRQPPPRRSATPAHAHAVRPPLPPRRCPRASHAWAHPSRKARRTPLRGRYATSSGERVGVAT